MEPIKPDSISDSRLNTNKNLEQLSGILDSELKIKNKNYKIKIDPILIQKLQLDINNSRDKRRKLARKYKISWNIYRKLEMLVTIRIQKGLNKSTGELL